MADDIDIEEHDVLESLRRRQMPDVVVKEEPIDEEYSESQYDPGNGSYEPDWDWESHGIDPAQIKIEQSDDAEMPFGKIILGSKPPETSQATNPPEEETGDKEEERQENYNYNMSLLLEDWGPILKASNCYCGECEILFATVNALDAHKMIAHSFLIAMDEDASPERNKAIKSTAKPFDIGLTCEICKYTFKGEKVGRSNLIRHYRNIHQVDPLKSESELKNWKICNHCNVYFPSDTALVKHLYELLPLNDVKDDKPSPAKVQSVVKVDNIKVATKVIRTPVKIDQGPTVRKSVKTDPVGLTVRKPVKSDIVPTVSNDGTPTPKPIMIKTVKPTLKQANSLILGSKINGVRVEVKKENEELIRSTDRKCEVCGIEYSRKYYVKHMRKFHPDVLIMKMNRMKKMQPLSSVRYKCMTCNLMCDGPTSARKHRVDKHPGMKGRKMFLKVVKTNKIVKVKNKPKVVNKFKKASTDDNDLIVSKSTVFKCNRCSVHFLTCYGACAHSRVCETSSNIRDWSCTICQRVFKSVDKKAHDFQHQTVGAKLKVYVVYLEMVVRILCECPYCYVCFEEYKFWRHIKFGCERDTESFFCNECRLPIDTSSKVSHESKHTQGDFTREDFIKIDFISSKKEVTIKTETIEKDIPVPTLKRKLMPEVLVTETPKQVNELHLFYCPWCKTYLTKKARQHVTGECRNMRSIKFKISCKRCGISFNGNTKSPHLRLHRKYPNLTLTDLTFTRLTDDKRMKPIPEYYPCAKCHVNFLAKGQRRMHECSKIKSFNCQVCHKKIEKQSFKMHMRFHNYVFPGKPKGTLKLESSLQKQEAKSPPKQLKLSEAQELPELLMKYQSLTTLWNILYVCETCDTFTDSYDKVVEHCQNHFTNMESYGVVIMKCQICNMKFDRECYRRHLELHAGSNDISRKSFKILRYDHAKLFSTEWLTFIDLPEDQKKQILTRSMYGDRRCVRMKLEQQGPPEYTVYKCKQCLKCIAPDGIIHHVSLKNCLKANKIVCPKCSMIFASRLTFDQHKKIHKTTDLDADSFRIVAFNDSADADLNKKILSEHDAGEVVVTAEATKKTDFPSKYVDNVKVVKGAKFFMFYKCADCEVCMLEKNVSPEHVCSTAKKVCPKCGLSFASNNFKAHVKLHDEIDINDKNVFTRTYYSTFVAIDDKGDAVEDNNATETVKTETKKDEANLYKCHCGLHFTSLKTIEKHYHGQNCSQVVREKCSHCFLVFDPNEIVNHLCKHHAQTKFQRFNVIVPKRKMLYKCKQCHVLFYDKRIHAVHKEKCDRVPNGIECDECGLAFDRSCIKAHRDDHGTSGKVKLDCYIVDNVSNDAKIDNNVLYKCKKCDVHYMEHTSARNHVTKYNHQTHLIKKCDQCGLRFSIKMMPRHVELHHNMLKIDRFRIKCIPLANTNNPVKEKPVSKVKVKEPKVNESVHEELDDTVESEITMRKEYKIYRCKKCKMHFTDGKTLLLHNEDRCSKELAEPCEECSLKFAVKNMNVHSKQHRGVEKINMVITEENDAIKEVTDDNNDTVDTATEDDEVTREDIDLNLYRCKYCNLHFNVKKSALCHITYGCDKTKRAPVKCEVCDIPFTKISAYRHQPLHDKFNLKKDDFVIIDIPEEIGDPVGVTDEQSQASTVDTAASLDSILETETSQQVTKSEADADLEAEATKVANVTLEAEASHTEAEVNKIKSNAKLYKCGDCNVFFMAQKTCYKHIMKHTPLNAKDYIECKLCGFQFVIAALQTHIKKHHAQEFKLEEILVQEYHPSVKKNNLPDVETYFAIEKEQSGLVSTSSDVNNDSKAETPKEIENEYSKVETLDVDSTEVTSNSNELIDDKVDALDT